jgi:VWFA-related protein
MKKFAVLLCLALFCVSFNQSYAQSGRTSPGSTNGKPNQRPPGPAASPTPSTKTPEEDKTNIRTDDPAEPVDENDIIRVDTQLVTIPVKVSDGKNRFFGGLKKEDFHVFEDGVEQEIAYFSNEEQPFTVALVLDMSYSTKFKIGEIQAAAIAFISQLRDQDRLMVISFDQEVHMLCEPTNDRQRIYRAIRSTKIANGTSLYDAVAMTMNDRLKRIQGRKAIVLFTDGVDTTSQMAHDMSNIRDAMELDALIYPIRYDTYADVQAMKNGGSVTKLPLPGGTAGTVTTNKGDPGGIRPPDATPGSIPFPLPVPQVGGSTGSNRGTTQEDYQNAERYLDSLATYTGGRVYMANTAANLNDSFTRIASELREFYSLGYYPKEDSAIVGKKKKIKVTVNTPARLAVRARDSYVVGKKQTTGKRK